MNAEASDFREVTKAEYDLLVTVPSCQERLTIFCNKDWLEEGLQLREGDHVDVYHKGLASDIPGILRYKGTVTGVEGIYFGVELVVSGCDFLRCSNELDCHSYCCTCLLQR